MKDDLTDLEKGIFRLAISVESLLLNGTQFGIIVSVGDGGFLKKVCDWVLDDLEALEQIVTLAPSGNTPRIRELLMQLRTLVVELIDLMNRLATFRTFSLQQLRTIVPQLSICREAVVRRLQEMEICLGTSTRMQASRPKEASASTEAFLNNLPDIFEGEWRRSNSTGKVTAASKK